MSISFALSNAMSGLNAAARMAEVVSANVANAQTEGYGRRVAELAAESVGGRGAGVRIDGILRVSDRALLADRRGAEAGLGAGNRRLDSLERLESAWGIGTQGATIEARITALEEALTAAAAEPASDIRLSRVASRLTDVATALRSASGAVRQERERADATIAGEVRTLNTALSRVEELNERISKARIAGDDALSLIDQRQQVIDTISAMVPVREVERDRGMVALFTTSGLALVDGRAVTVGFAPTPTIMPGMTHAGGALGGLTVDGAPVPGGGATGRLTGGSLAAAFALRDEVLPAQQDALDALARDLISRFEDPAVDPTLGGGDAGLLTDAGNPLDPLDTVGLAGRLAVNPAVDPAAGGALFRLRDGVNATSAGPVGRADQLHAWLDALAQPQALAGGGQARSAAGHAAVTTGALGAARLEAEDEVAYAAASYNGLRERELALGVDTDAEMQTLLLVEQSYAANARVIETVDFLIRRLMEI
jgi:flagellar hook-associated protein 1 FlgK